MGFMDEVSSGGGTKLLKFDGKAGSYVVRGSEATFNGQEFLADVYSATGGFLKFNGKGQQSGVPVLSSPRTLPRRAPHSGTWTKARGPMVALVTGPKTFGRR